MEMQSPPPPPPHNSYSSASYHLHHGAAYATHYRTSSDAFACRHSLVSHLPSHAPHSLPLVACPHFAFVAVCLPRSSTSLPSPPPSPFPTMYLDPTKKWTGHGESIPDV